MWRGHGGEGICVIKSTDCVVGNTKREKKEEEIPDSSRAHDIPPKTPARSYIRDSSLPSKATLRIIL